MMAGNCTWSVMLHDTSNKQGTAAMGTQRVVTTFCTEQGKLSRLLHLTVTFFLETEKVKKALITAWYF